MQTRGFQAPKGGACKKFRPTRTKPCLTFHAWMHVGWLCHTLDLIQWPSDWSSKPLGKLCVRLYGETLKECCMWTFYEKIEQIIWGTWESNPGPSTHQATSLANWAIARVCHMNGKQLLYKKNKYYGIKQNKNAPDLNVPTTGCHLCFFFVCTCKHE